MKLKTSFFNPTVLKKDITRFAPVWGLYTVFTLLFVLLLWESESSAARFVNNAPELFLSMGLVNFFYAPIAAIFLFGDLFKSRMCNMLHALPLRREGWFLTHLTAGSLFCIVPNGVAALLTAALLQQYAWVAFLWLGLMVMQYLFFFGVAAFACLCAGNRLGALAVYGIVNFLAVLISWLTITFYEPLLYGIKLDFHAFAKYSPIVRFSNAKYLDFYYDNMYEKAIFGGFFPEDWRHLGICAGIGVVLLGLSLLIYRKRHLESAEDMIAFRPAAPVALTLYTLCVGAVLYFIANATAPALEYIFLAIGLGIGFFTGKMLLERRVKVFRGKTFLAFGLFAVVFALSLGIARLDPLGITRYVPEADQIACAKLSSSHYVYETNQPELTLTEAADIDRILSIHRDCTEETLAEDSTTIPLYIRYALKNGTVLERYYYVDADSDSAKYLQSYFSSAQAVFQGDNPEKVLADLRWIECYSYEKDHPCIAITKDPDDMDIDHYTEKYGEDLGCIAYELEGDPAQDPVLSGLFQAIIKDCAAGHMAQSWEFSRSRQTIASITLEYKKNSYKGYLNINIFDDCENTIGYLKSLQSE